MATQVQVWKATDGSIHENEQDALKREAEIEFAETSFKLDKSLLGFDKYEEMGDVDKRDLFNKNTLEQFIKVGELARKVYNLS
jgi:hypothetical protein